MINIEKLDNELYKATYEKANAEKRAEIWKKIKSNPDILRKAVEVTRDKFDERDTVRGLSICDAILMNYDSIDEVVYNNLISSIYSNPDIARIVVNGASNGGFSFLLMSLFNHNLKLTEEQKKFAVNEAMNKIGTVRWKQNVDEFSQKLDDVGISDDTTSFIDIDGSVNLIGQKSGSQYMNYICCRLSTTQAHGVGEFDIRYYILRNSNWSLDEKQKLIMDFWHDDDVYDECLEQWELEIVNDPENIKRGYSLLLDKFDLYEYTYEMLFNLYKDKGTTDKIWDEIQFCRQMHELRPQQWELEDVTQKKVLVQNNDNKKKS